MMRRLIKQHIQDSVYIYIRAHNISIYIYRLVYIQVICKWIGLDHACYISK